MKFFIAVAFVLTICSCLHGRSGATFPAVWLYSHGSNAKFTFKRFRTCYTFEKLWADRAVRAKWDDLREKYSISFFKNIHCHGDNVTSSDTPSGSYSFEENNKLNLAVSSFVVRQNIDQPPVGLDNIKADAPDYPDVGA